MQEMTVEKRILEIISMAAEHVLNKPFETGDFWFLGDLRDNYNAKEIMAYPLKTITFTINLKF